MKCRKCGASGRGVLKVVSTRCCELKFTKTRIMQCSVCGCSSYSLEIPIPANKILCNRHYTAKEIFIDKLIGFAYSL